METLEVVWPPWVAALYLTEQHQFGNTVEELFHFLQTREPDRSPARNYAPMTAVAIQEFGHMSVEEALQVGYNQQLVVFSLCPAKYVVGVACRIITCPSAERSVLIRR